MTEEKKEETQARSVEQAAQKSAEPVKPAEETKKETVKAERPANCVSCNTSLKMKRWYYRNGKYYCSKRCWQTASKKEKAPAQESTPQ